MPSDSRIAFPGAWAEVPYLGQAGRFTYTLNAQFSTAMRFPSESTM